jgi:hypothetical protein
MGKHDGWRDYPRKLKLEPYMQKIVADEAH